MKALILAGGKGKRLTILTKEIPKHFLTVLNKPIIFYILDNLIRYHIDDIELSLNHKKNFYIRNLKSAYNDKIKNPSFSYDNNMKGPWLPIIEKLKKENNDLLIACAGDIFASVNYKRIIQFHRQQGKPVTVVVAKTYPTPKAMTFKVKNNLLKSCKRVKISRKEDYINIGIYIINRDLINFIPAKLKSFYEDDLFRIFTKNNLAAAYVMPDKGFNINTVYNLLCANLYQLKKIKNLKQFNNKLYKIVPPIFMGKNVVIKKNSIIGPNVIIGDNVIINENSKINNSVVNSHSKIGKNVRLSYSLIGSNSTLKDNSILIKTVFVEEEKECFKINLSDLKNELKK